MPFIRDHFNGYCKGVEGNLAPPPPSPPPRPSLEDSKKINWKKEKKTS